MPTRSEVNLVTNSSESGPLRFEFLKSRFNIFVHLRGEINMGVRQQSQTNLVNYKIKAKHRGGGSKVISTPDKHQ